MNEPVRNHITLLELQSLIKRELERTLPLTYWITAEVSEIKVNYSGHCYMQLVEKSSRSQQPQASASASAVAWRSLWGSIEAHFRSATGGDIAPGMKLLLKVSVSYHELYGLSLVVSDIDPAYTLGDMEREKQQTIARLTREGVMDMNREIPLPPFFQRIAVVSSRNAAGFQDFMKEAERSPHRFEITLFDAFMQGEAAEESIIVALDAIAGSYADFDGVVVIRGGGSQSDLSCFNSYRLCSHIAQFPLPVITGIGHDKDRSVADMVAAVELKTPTAVAAYLVELMQAEDEMLSSFRDTVLQHMSGILERHKQGITRQSIALMRISSAMTRSLELRLAGYAAQTAHKARAAITAHRSNHIRLQKDIKDISANALSASDVRLRLMYEKITAYDPRRIMALGFSVARVHGKILKNAADVAPGEIIELSLSDGRIVAKVEKKI